MSRCEHYACRCVRAAELAHIADISGNPRYLKQALDVHSQRVRCCQSDYMPSDLVISRGQCAVCSAPENTPHSAACDWYGIVSRQSLRAPT